jgi:two-component system chemotaxis sensor kinase CheA
MNETIANRLRPLEALLATLDPADPETLAQIGLGLEDALTQLPETWVEGVALVTLCLEALQALYLGEAPDPVATIRATRSAIGAAERCLRSGRYASAGPIRATGQALWQSLGREIDDSPWGTAPAEPNWPGAENEPEAVPDPEPAAPPPSTAADPMDEIVQEFLVESSENLDQLDQDLLVLERDPQNRETLSSVFRTIHTIKGTCGFLGFSRLEALAHAGENLLSRLRDGALILTPPIADALLATVDAVRQILASIGAGQGEGNGDYALLVATLTRLQTPQSTPVETVSSAPEPLSASTPPIDDTDHGDGAIRGEARNGIADASIRVDVGLLDTLMNLVGELVLARNQIQQFMQSGAHQKDPTLSATAQRLNLITTELQEGVMKTRMQPIGNIWAKYPRIVRDLAHTCGKQVRLELEGKETDLDKTLIEAIKDPLTHVVRNAIDHGIESPDARVAAGKPAEGCLSLRAYHEGGQVNIEIADDGAGIDPERVRAKALERGVITAEQAARMTEREVVQLIFQPGFSTAAKVTNVSGRGVSMDVVRTNIERISGTIDIQTRPGHGTTLRIKIPLTLAIIPALIVTSGGERFAIPQGSLVELLRLEGEQARTTIESLFGTPVARRRGKLLPLAYLNGVLDLAPGTADDVVNIVVLQADGRQFGLVVDHISDTEEIVVKPLSPQLKSTHSFAGATIMGDGRVALILDVLGLAQHARVIDEVRERTHADTARTEATVGDVQTLLLFEAGTGGHLAIPLSAVARLEEIPVSQVEHSSSQEVIQYRGGILPLIRVADHLPHYGGADPDPGTMLQVVVYNDGRRSAGLIVDRITDIVETALAIRRDCASDGVLGSVVIQGRVTDLLDIEAIVQRADPIHEPQPYLRAA